MTVLNFGALYIPPPLVRQVLAQPASHFPEVDAQIKGRYDAIDLTPELQVGVRSMPEGNSAYCIGSWGAAVVFTPDDFQETPNPFHGVLIPDGYHPNGLYQKHLEEIAEEISKRYQIFPTIKEGVVRQHRVYLHLPQVILNRHLVRPIDDSKANPSANMLVGSYSDIIAKLKVPVKA